MPTTKTKLICLAILLAHLAISHVILPAIGQANVFPFFDWNLFSYNPRVQVWGLIRVYEVDGQAVDPPQFVSHHRDLYPGRDAFLVPHQIARLTSMLERFGPYNQATQSSREELEDNLFFDRSHATYEVISATLDIREILHSENLKRATRLAVFVYEKKAHP